MQTLEASKAFPYVAWITVVMFSVFTYNLVSQLKDSIKELDQQTTALDQSIQALHAVKK